ncbi:phosphoribosylpyrophosphate synthetase [Flavobacterium sp.]|uniref:phosphoribosylpyrophosphate synthetase n=1 Tax=Flavobacterium sp. TaxID=239 RepID=UPI00286E5D98|nr:phosphoribosylpyrophosphate synthetase [Flavobacterium sp.]
MILSTDNSLVQDIEFAKKSGFTADFMYINKKIIDRKTKKEYTDRDCFLVEFCRHEGMNDPSDSSILFLIECIDNIKGCLSSAYGKDADPNLIEFVINLNKKEE